MGVHTWYMQTLEGGETHKRRDQYFLESQMYQGAPTLWCMTLMEIGNDTKVGFIPLIDENHIIMYQRQQLCAWGCQEVNFINNSVCW